MTKIKMKQNFVIVIIVMILLFSGSFLTSFVSPNTGVTMTSENAYESQEETKELYNKSTGNFNKKVMTELLDTLFGEQNPVSYIKTMTESQTGSYVIPATEINAKVGSPEGLRVMLDGREWIAASLTITDVNGIEDAVLTLYLAQPDGVSKSHSYNTDNPGNNVYSSSFIRHDLLTDSKWSLFNQTGENSFATRYLVQPKNINYHHKQTQIGRGFYQNQLINEALDELNNGWYINKPKPSDTYKNPNGEMTRYDAWGNDYIWLPSMTETGGIVNRPKVSSIWQLSAEQLSFSAGETAMLRSGSVSTYNQMYDILSNGEISSNYCNVELGVRPAIHLNLSAVTQELNSPNDMQVTYNEQVHTIKSLANDTKADWFDSDIFEHKDNYIDITYPNDINEFKESGDYWVKFEITENYINAFYKQVDIDGAQNGWSDDYIALVKEKRKPKFRGEADTTDSEHIESDTVRWIKVTIKKMDIDFSKVEWSADKLEYNALNQSVTIKSGLPSCLTLTYSNNVKKDLGTYTAEIIEIESNNENYNIPENTELVNYPTLKHNWQIVKKKIVTQWMREGTTQDGVTIALPVLDMGDIVTAGVDYTYYKDSAMTQQITLDEIFAEFDLTEVKTYWVKATLKTSGGDFNATNCTLVFNGTESTELVATMQTGSTSNSVSVDITNKKVVFNNGEQQAIFSVSGGGLTANDLIVSYFASDGTPLQSAPKNAGKYKVSVELRDDLKDFIIIGKTQFDFEIESLKIKKPLANQIQFFEEDGFELSDVANMPSNWKTYFEIKVYDKDNNQISPENDNWNFVNVNNYRIEIIFKDGTNTSNGCVADNVLWSDSDKNAFAVTLEIKPLVFIMLGWQENSGNKKPVLLGGDAEEIKKYFDFVIYEIRNGIIIGNMLPANTSLKYNTNYQISLRAKDTFEGNVFVEYNGEIISETEPYQFKTAINPNPGSGDNDGENDGSDDNNGEGSNGTNGGNNNNGSNGGNSLWTGTNGNLSLFGWVLIIGNVFAILLLIVLIFMVTILLQNRKAKENIVQTLPPVSAPVNTQDTSSLSEGEKPQNSEDLKDSNQAVTNDLNNNYVNAHLMKNNDWTFIVREKDILNIKALENKNERVLMYACRESEVKKLKKFKTALEDVSNEIESDNEKDSKSKGKKKGKKNK